MNIISKKYLYFILSGIIIIPGLVSLVLNGLLFSIDFTGGSKLEVSVTGNESLKEDRINKVLQDNKINTHNIKLINSQTVSIRTEAIDQNTNNKIIASLKSEYKTLKENSFETVGATIGNETKTNALKAVVIASIAITLYIAFAFREVSKPVSSWKFGVCAIAALLHDVLVVVGVFSLLGYFFKVEVDSLFITALLTVMGFSVHDTIVVFDRIRENLKKNIGLSFEEVVNNSILETLNRSLNTSLTVIIVLLSLLFLGGENIRWFVIALLVGIISGTYSSIFNASPLLVVWFERNKKS